MYLKMYVNNNAQQYQNFIIFVNIIANFCYMMNYYDHILFYLLLNVIQYHVESIIMVNATDVLHISIAPLRINKPWW